MAKTGLGTGIGLALVKELVELHAGEISVQSVYEQEALDGSDSTGTSFCVTLPLGRAHLSDNELAQNEDVKTESLALFSPSATDEGDASKPIDSLAHKKASVLVVDDNQDMQRYISRLLVDEYHVATANDGLLAEASLKPVSYTHLTLPTIDSV